MIIGSMIIGNEIDRYLQASLTKLLSSCDKVFVAGDQTTDGSIELAEKMGCHIWSRPDKCASFLESESEFRQAAWDQLGKQLRLKNTDWVVSVDADEYLIPDINLLKSLAKIAEVRTCFSTPIEEIWNLDPLQKRVDGFWDRNYNRRIGRWNKELKFKQIPMGCGSLPYISGSTELDKKMGILHFGYADKDDRVQKHERYSSMSDHGHNQTHIDSIIKKATVEPIDMKIEFWRGIR